MSRRPRLGMSNAEMVRFSRTNHLHCIEPTCEGWTAQVALSPGWFKECACGRRWDYRSAGGAPCTKAEYEARAAKMFARERQRDGPAGQSSTPTSVPIIGRAGLVMAKKTAKKVAAKKVTKCVATQEPTFYGPVGLKFVVCYKGKEVAAQIAKDGFKAGGKTFAGVRDLGEFVTGKRWRDCVIDGIARALAAAPAKMVKPAVAKVVTKVAAKVTKVTKPPEGDGASDE